MNQVVIVDKNAPEGEEFVEKNVVEVVKEDAVLFPCTLVCLRVAKGHKTKAASSTDSRTEYEISGINPGQEDKIEQTLRDVLLGDGDAGNKKVIYIIMQNNAAIQEDIDDAESITIKDDNADIIKHDVQLTETVKIVKKKIQLILSEKETTAKAVIKIKKTTSIPWMQGKNFGIAPTGRFDQRKIVEKITEEIRSVIIQQPMSEKIFIIIGHNGEINSFQEKYGQSHTGKKTNHCHLHHSDAVIFTSTLAGIQANFLKLKKRYTNESEARFIDNPSFSLIKPTSSTNTAQPEPSLIFY